MKTGLISISFRSLSAKDVAGLCVKAGLSGVEWGGDLHCPHGDLAKAKELRALCAGSGLETVSYGSYYKLAESESAGLPFGKVLESAVALGAPRIRVWAGNFPSAKADAAYRAKVAEDLRRICADAAKAGVLISLEYHLNSLTDDISSALALLSEAPEALCQWQPIQGLSKKAKTESLEKLLGPRLANIHVFEWVMNPETRHVDRRPLSEGVEAWRGWLKAASGSPNCQWALLEFVRDESPEQLMADAATLSQMLR